MALGAQRSDVLQLVFASAVVSVGVGMAMGALFSFWSGKVIARSTTMGLWDLQVLLGAALVLMIASAAAAILPTRRVLSIDPMDALRCE
jgi:ABC-type antimicrobial peptide transport system permease subunit